MRSSFRFTGSSARFVGASISTVVLAVSLSAAAGLAPGAAAAGASPFQVLRSTSEEAAVEVTSPLPQLLPGRTPLEAFYSVADWSECDQAGAPDLPCTRFQLALPPGTRPVMTVKVLATTLVPGPPPSPAPQCRIRTNPNGPPFQTLTYERDESVFAREFPSVWAQMNQPVVLRSLRLVPIDIYPYHWNPAAGGVEVATRMEIDVQFVADSSPGMRRARRNEAPVLEEPTWKRLYKQSALNADQAVGWTRAPLLRRAAPMRRAMMQTGPEFRLTVDHTDIYRVTWESLVAAGWTQTDVPVQQLALVERFFDESDTLNPFHENDVPIAVRDRNGSGVFDAGDDFFFFGLSAWDRLHPPNKDKRYGRNNAYFLTVRPEGGAQMATGPSYLNLTGLTPVPDFVWTDHLEGDGVYMVSIAANDLYPTQYLTKGTDAIRADHFLWVGGDPDSVGAPFDLPGLRSLLHLRIDMQGIKFPDPNRDARVWLRVSIPPPSGHGPGTVVPLLPDSVTVPRKTETKIDLTDTDLAGLHPARKGNLLCLTESQTGYGAALNWMEWTYRRDFGAVNRELAWSTNDLQGQQEFDISGFDSADTLLVFEVTDSVFASPRGPRSLIVNRYQNVNGTLHVQLDLGTGGSPRTFYALSAAAAAPPARIDPVSSTDLTAPEGADEQLIAITVADFMDAVTPLIQQRRSEGLSARLVSIQDVYDQFNGGRAWPTAIRNYLRYLWRVRTVKPSYLLLVGDASEDFANVTRDSEPDLVPTQTLFSYAYADQNSELVSSDEWFVDRLSNFSSASDSLDFYPDMAVGRLPVQNVDQCERVVRKILRYGNFQDSDTWRSRGLFVSDDEFSSDISFTGTYSWKGTRAPRYGTDTAFRLANEQVLKMIRNEAGFPDFAADSFYTACYMDTVACLGRCANPIKNGSDDCANWRCPPDSAFSGWHSSSWYSRTVSYSTPTFDPKTDNLDWASTNLPVKLRSYMSGQQGGGYLFLDYQGHANIGIMSHEWIFVDIPAAARSDVSLLQNTWPFFYMGFGCHLAQFSSFNKKVMGACISEKLVEVGGEADATHEGAIASYASTAYEWLTANQVPDLALFRSWFVNPPVDQSGRAHWILGDIVTGGKIRMMTDYPGATAQGMVATYTLLGDPSMPMEMGAPLMDVRLNCPSGRWDDCPRWQAGDPLTAMAGSDTAVVRVRLTDEAQIGRITVIDNGVTVPDSALVLVPVPGVSGSGRARDLTYKPVLQPPLEDYSIEIQAADNFGLERKVDLPVRLEAAFSVVRGGVTTLLRSGDLLEKRDSLLVDVTSPVDLTQDQIALFVDNDPLTIVRAVTTDSRQWRLHTVMPDSLGEENHQIHLQVQRPLDPAHPVAERHLDFRGATEGQVQLLEVFNFPNPFTDQTGFYYRLNRNADWARVRVFTLSGRRIWQGEGTAHVDRNVIAWDGRDQDGDQVANGLYFYKVDVHSFDGRTVSKIERVARIR